MIDDSVRGPIRTVPEDTRRAIIRTLDALDEHLGSRGLVHRMGRVPESLAVFQIMSIQVSDPFGPSMQGRGRVELIVLPSSKKVDKIETDRALRELDKEHSQDPRVRNIIVVRDTWPGKREFPEGFIPIDSDELWQRLSGLDIRSQPDWVRKEQGRIQKEYVSRKLRRICTPAESAVSEDPDLKSATQILEDWAIGLIPESKGLIIVAERGSGKTWCLRRTTQQMYHKHRKNPWTVPAPVLIELQDYGKCLRQNTGARRSIAGYLHEQMYIRGVIGIPMIEALLNCGAFFLLLDGLDELRSEATDLEFESHVRDLFRNIPPLARVVATSRETKFSSYSAMAAMVTTTEFENNIDSNERYIPKGSQRELSHNLKIYYLVNFDVAAIDQLDKNLLTEDGPIGEDTRGTVRERLLKSGRRSGTDPTHQEELADALIELGRVPAASRDILLVLAECDGRSLLEVFESVVLSAFIAYNLETDRASAIVRFKTGDANIRQEVLGLAERLEMIGRIAQFLLEQDEKTFSVQTLRDVFSESFGPTFDQLISDMRSQTVFSFAGRETDSEGRLRFRAKSIWAYFIARHLFSLLADRKTRTCEEGMKILGRFFLRGSEEQRWTLAFLNEMFRKGCIIFGEGETEFYGLKEHSRLRIELSDLQTKFEDFGRRLGPFSIWTRHWSDNLKSLELSPRSVGEEWRRIELRYWAKGVLITGDQEHNPFLIGLHEVTNREFQDFLRDDTIPSLKGGSTRKLVFEKRRAESRHPLSWAAFHNSDSQKQKHSSDFIHFSNSYHLFGWPLGDLDKDQEMHPVVWISLYVALIYCNWRTTVDQELGPEQCSYEIGVDRRNRPFHRLNKRRLGYRIPTTSEWRFAARAGEKGRFPWSRKLEEEDEKAKRAGQRYRDFLMQERAATEDVRKYQANEFGVLGMIGNVREWVWESEDPENPILGASWVLGEVSFGYDYGGSRLPNTAPYPDVGFRVARSVDSTLEEKIRDARNDPQPEPSIFDRTAQLFRFNSVRSSRNRK